MRTPTNLTLLIGAVYVILRVWQLIELELYGAVQERAVDTVITILWIAAIILSYAKGYLDGRDDRLQR